MGGKPSPNAQSARPRGRSDTAWADDWTTGPYATDLGLELWVLDDQDYPKAKKILDAWDGPAAGPRTPWWCGHCKETIQGQFTSCWKCGKEREEA
jgi:hypothetical protein